MIDYKFYIYLFIYVKMFVIVDNINNNIVLMNI